MKSLKPTILISFLFLTSCNTTILKSEFIDNIRQGDTLTLYAEYADCGEWGGHMEKLYVTNTENILWISFYKDTVSCDNEPNVSRKKIIEKSKILETNERNKVVKYINKFLVDSKIEQETWSNASNYFKIINKDSTFEFVDRKMSWKEFRILRDEIFY
jgi:hypothetical protein